MSGVEDRVGGGMRTSTKVSVIEIKNVRKIDYNSRKFKATRAKVKTHVKEIKSYQNINYSKMHYEFNI
jgi:hypothetical protein